MVVIVIINTQEFSANNLLTIVNSYQHFLDNPPPLILVALNEYVHIQ